MEKRLQKLPLKDDSTNDDDMSERSSVLQPWGTNRNALPSCKLLVIFAKNAGVKYSV